MFELSVYATQAMHGVVSGMLLFLVASGLTLVFGMMGILNIAHAGFYMLGAYLAYSMVHVTGHFWLRSWSLRSWWGRSAPWSSASSSGAPTPSGMPTSCS